MEKIDAIYPSSAQHRKTLTNETEAGIDRSSQYVGVVQCPCATHGGDDTPLFGYLFWRDIVHDVNHDISQNGDLLSIIMCPNNYHGELNQPNMTIQRSNVLIQCGAMGEPDGCTVEGATVAIGKNLENVTIQGVEFVSQRHEFSIGQGSRISLIRCRFSDTIFPGTETLRSAIVSHGDLTIVDSYFSGNYGGGAVHVVQQKASFMGVQFIDNTASQSKSSASAIQVGDSTKGKIANVSIIDSCFENNFGTNIVFVQEGSLVLRNRDNAVLSTSHGETNCHGITIQSGTGSECKKFQLFNISCQDAFNRRGPIVVDTVAPAATPTITFNNSNISADIAPSPIQPAPSPKEITLSPVSTPKKMLTLQPTVSDSIADGESPATSLDLTINDDIVPLDITNDITFETSGYDLHRRELWLVAIFTTITTVVHRY